MRKGGNCASSGSTRSRDKTKTYAEYLKMGRPAAVFTGRKIATGKRIAKQPSPQRQLQKGEATKPQKRDTNCTQYQEETNNVQRSDPRTGRKPGTKQKTEG